VGLRAAGGAPVACDDAVAAAADLLKAGAIVAVKGLGGYHLAVDAENPAAVARLRRRKHRDDKPFAVMSRDLTAVAHYARATPDEAALLTACQRPIVLLAKSSPQPLAAAIAPGNRWIGVMLPYTPLHYLLFADSDQTPNVCQDALHVVTNTVLQRPKFQISLLPENIEYHR
jgi:hydrogenase maturation protein HypF